MECSHGPQGAISTVAGPRTARYILRARGVSGGRREIVVQPPQEQQESDRLGDYGLDYFTELTAQYVEDTAGAKLMDVEQQSDRNVVWFEFEGVEMSVSVYPGSPAVCIGADTRIPYHDFQANVAWILRTCADYGVGIDLDVDSETGETWMFVFLRVFWAGYNYEVFTAVCDDLVQCRKALEARLPIAGAPAE